MDRNLQTIENALTRLGEAHRAGAFAGQKGTYPWQTARGAAAKPAHRFAWVRVAASLAAAAAVAVVFIGPSLMTLRQTREIPGNLPVAMPTETVNVVAEAPAPTAPVHRDECDFNGDGVVNGLDIQSFVARQSETSGAPQVDAATFERCLLRSS